METQYKLNVKYSSECISNITNKFNTNMKNITQQINHIQLLTDMCFSQDSKLYNQVAKQLDQVVTEVETLCGNLKESLLCDQSVINKVKFILKSCNQQQNNIDKLVEITSQRYVKIHFSKYPILTNSEVLKQVW